MTRKEEGLLKRTEMRMLRWLLGASLTIREARWSCKWSWSTKQGIFELVVCSVNLTLKKVSRAGLSKFRKFPPRKFPPEHFPPYVRQVAYMFTCMHVFLSNVLFNYPGST